MTCHNLALGLAGFAAGFALTVLIVLFFT